MFTSPQTFINLPVKDLQASINFFTKLGFTFNPQFTDENATCMVINENTFVMLLVETFFSTFTNKEISNSIKSTEVIISLSASSIEEIKEKIALVLTIGGIQSMEPIIDSDWMYSSSFQDLDGHIWEFVYMDMGKISTE